MGIVPDLDFYITSNSNTHNHLHCFVYKRNFKEEVNIDKRKILKGGYLMRLNGRYVVMFKHPNASSKGAKIETFKGVCENFISLDLCAFKNDDDEMLLVNYKDILQMKPIK
jgi:hypothetical protein